MFYRLLAACIITLPLAATHSAFARPFHHPFGELREYHKHWLAVCPDKFNPGSRSDYKTTCWASTFTGNPDGTMNGAFPGYRLSVSRHRKTGKLAITFVSDGMESIDQTRPIKLQFSNWTILQFKYGTEVTPNRNSGNEYIFTDPAQTLDLVKRMKAANHVIIRFPLKQGERDMQFSTIGLRNALRFTEKYASPN